MKFQPIDCESLVSLPDKLEHESTVIAQEYHTIPPPMQMM